MSVMKTSSVIGYSKNSKSNKMYTKDTENSLKRKGIFSLSDVSHPALRNQYSSDSTNGVQDDVSGSEGNNVHTSQHTTNSSSLAIGSGLSNRKRRSSTAYEEVKAFDKIVVSPN